jgi:hypothetical protein
LLGRAANHPGGAAQAPFAVSRQSLREGRLRFAHNDGV